jgi:hypothetical protein
MNKNPLRNGRGLRRAEKAIGKAGESISARAEEATGGAGYAKRGAEEATGGTGSL